MAGALARDPVLARALTDPDRVRLWTYSLGVKGPAAGTADAVAWGVERLAVEVEKLGGGIVGVLDVHEPAGRFHAHVLVLLPTRVSARLLVRAWCSLPWAAERQPLPKVQSVRPVTTAGDLVAVCLHHIGGKARHPDAAAFLPPLRSRVWASGALRGPWERATTPVRLPVAPWPPARASEAPAQRKASTVASQPQVEPGACGWCGRSRPPRMRADARWCSRDCRKAASRALRNAERGGALRADVAELEADGWPRPAALRVALAAAVGRTVDPEVTVDSRVVAGAWRCRCGQPLALGLDARGCGSSTCRTARWRIRRERGLWGYSVAGRGAPVLVRVARETPLGLDNTGQRPPPRRHAR